MRRSTLALTLSGALALSGCVAGGGQPIAYDADDTCGPIRQELKQEDEFFSQALAVAFAAAIVGGLAAGVASGDVGTGIVAGLAAGAAAAIASSATSGQGQQQPSYLQAKQRQFGANQNQLFSSMTGDLQQENARIDKTQAVFDRLVSCRRGQAETIRREYRALGSGRNAQLATYQARMDRVKGWYAQDIEIARSISKNLQTRSTEFASSTGQLKPQQLQQAQRRPNRPPADPLVAETTTNQRKTADAVRKVEVAAADQASFQLG